MAKLFLDEETVIINIVSGGGAGMTDSMPKLQVTVADSLAAMSDSYTMLARATYADVLAAQSEGLKLAISGTALADTIAGLAEGITIEVIYIATGSFIVPTGITSLTVQCRGGGQGGAVGTTTGGTGGTGGSYARSVLTVTAGSTQTVTVGAAPAAGGVGNDTWFGAATTIRAKGGGSANTNIGTTVFTGGPGAAGALLGAGGVGGGGAGDANNAAGQAGGVAGGGAGGAASTVGTAPGGGSGGGAGSATSPGPATVGTRGELHVKWTAA